MPYCSVNVLLYVDMCRNGIEFVFQEFSQTPETPTPQYLSYLTILSEFSSKLLKPDKRTVYVLHTKHRLITGFLIAQTWLSESLLLPVQVLLPAEIHCRAHY